jgi:biopolymer transport protein ExbD
MAAKLSGGGGDRFNVEQNSEINVTPFVDVMLVLLIIFMVAAPLASVSVEVNLPPAVAKASQNPPKPVYISIKADGSVYIGDFETTIDSMGADLQEHRQTRSDQGAYLHPRRREDALRSFHGGDEHPPGQRLL